MADVAAFGVQQLGVGMKWQPIVSCDAATQHTFAFLVGSLCEAACQTGECHCCVHKAWAGVGIGTPPGRWSCPWPGCLRRPCVCARHQPHVAQLTQLERDCPPAQQQSPLRQCCISTSNNSIALQVVMVMIMTTITKVSVCVPASYVWNMCYVCLDPAADFQHQPQHPSHAFESYLMPHLWNSCMCNTAYGIVLNFVLDVTHPIRQTTAPTTELQQQEEKLAMPNTHHAMLLAIHFCWLMNTRRRWIAET